MKREIQKNIKLIGILVDTVKLLDRFQRGHGHDTSHLLLKEATGEVYKHARQLYDFDEPDNTRAMLHKLLKTPLGVLLQGADFKNLKEKDTRLRILIAREEAALQRKLDSRMPPTGELQVFPDL